MLKTESVKLSAVSPAPPAAAYCHPPLESEVFPKQLPPRLEAPMQPGIRLPAWKDNIFPSVFPSGATLEKQTPPCWPSVHPGSWVTRLLTELHLMFVAVGIGVVWKTGCETLTFGWEVGLALSLVGPVHHQVPEATETVGDLIYEEAQAQREKQA